MTDGGPHSSIRGMRTGGASVGGAEDMMRKTAASPIVMFALVGCSAARLEHGLVLQVDETRHHALDAARHMM